MSSETENFDFSSNVFIENNAPREKPLHKGFFVLKKELLVMLGTIVLILVISLSLSICSLTELKSLEKKVGTLDEKVGENYGKLEDLSIEMESTIAENKLYNGFERVGKYGYFLKLEGNKKMNYSEGQKACSKLFGHIFEIPDYSVEEYKSKYTWMQTYLLFPDMFLPTLQNVTFWRAIRCGLPKNA